MANFAALRAAVFSLPAKNRTGGLKSTPPPPVRGLTEGNCIFFVGFVGIFALRARGALRQRTWSVLTFEKKNEL